MSEQQAPSHEDKPAVAGPTADTGAQEQDLGWWQNQYKEIQAGYTRGQQRIKELEDQHRWYETALTSEDADTRRQAIEALGYALPEAEEAYEEEQPLDYDNDPYEALRAELDSVKESLAQRTESEHEAAREALMLELTSARLDELEGLDEQDQNWVLAYATHALPAVREPGVPVPLPDIRGAYEAFVARETERQKQWATTKRSPYVAPGGQEATEVPDLDTHQGRVDFALRQLQDGTAT